LEKRIEGLRQEGAQLRKQALDSMRVECIDLTKVKPGEKYDGSHYFLENNRKIKEMRAKIFEFKVCLPSLDLLQYD